MQITEIHRKNISKSGIFMKNSKKAKTLIDFEVKATTYSRTNIGQCVTIGE